MQRKNEPKIPQKLLGVQRVELIYIQQVAGKSSMTMLVYMLCSKRMHVL